MNGNCPFNLNYTVSTITVLLVSRKGRKVYSAKDVRIKEGSKSNKAESLDPTVLNIYIIPFKEYSIY